MKIKRIIIVMGLIPFSMAISQDLIFKNSFETTITRLNDTGISWGGDYPILNNLICESNIAYPQDCDDGRDVTENQNSDGFAGFSFTKLDQNGTPLVNQSADYETTPWACVEDNVTGLIWEVKTIDGGLHDMNDTYNWYDTNANTNGGTVGYENADGDICFGYIQTDNASFCNSQAYTERVNAEGLCGYNDWRLPKINEFHSISHHGTYNPAIDTQYFPNATTFLYWTASADSFNRLITWIYNSFTGSDGGNTRDRDNSIRLVRGGM